MQITDWERINALMVVAFQQFGEIKPNNTPETKSELLRSLQGTRLPLSSYLVNAICNDTSFYDSLLWGIDMMSFSGEEACLPMLDVLIVLSNSRTVKIQNKSRPEMKTFLSGEDKEALERMLIDKIESLQQAGVLSQGWHRDPCKAKREFLSYIKSVTIERKEVKGRIYLGLYDTIPWPSRYKETDKCILIYRIGLMLGIDSQNDGDIDKSVETDYSDDGILRQEIYHKVSSVIRVQRNRKNKSSKSE